MIELTDEQAKVLKQGYPIRAFVPDLCGDVVVVPAAQRESTEVVIPEALDEIRPIDSDQRMARLESELKTLAHRVHKQEVQDSKLSIRPSFPPRAAEPVFSPLSAVEAECDAWEEIEGIEFRSTELFERELAALPCLEREGVINTINAKSQLLVTDRTASARVFVRPLKVLLHRGLESSLTEVSVGSDLTVLLTLDDDPIFGQAIVTLLRVVRSGESEQAFSETVELLYPKEVLDIQKSEK